MLKLALYAVLAYLLLRAVANLFRAMRKQGQVGPNPRRTRFGTDGRGRSANGKQEQAERATRLRDEEEIEDARWEDL